MPSPLIKRFMVLAVFSTAMAAVVIPEIIEGTTADKSLSLRNSLAVRTPGWNGETGILAPRRNTVALFATTVASLSTVVVGTCSSPFAAVLGPYPCVAAVTASVIVGVISLFGTIISATTKRDVEKNDYFTWHYPSIEGGMSSIQRVQHAFDVEFSDGLPVVIGQTNCNEKWDTCHKIWYSKSTYLHTDGTNHTYHKVTATPHSHDYRSNTSTTTTTTSALYPRQTNDNTANVQSENGTTLYGGYVWEEGTEATLADIYNEGSDESDTDTDVADDILGIMNSENEASGKYADQGVYCQDWASSADSAPGSEGYLWYYMDESDYPASDESALLMTCAEQDQTPASRK